MVGEPIASEETMATTRDFKAFAALVKKLSPGTKKYAAWDDRPGLPKSVRAFWKAVGVPPYRSDMVPKASKAEDEAALKEVFERWFSDAATRDRWALEPADEPIPWRHLPANPRVVASRDWAVLLASDIDPEPTLHILWQNAPRPKRLRFSYFFWCMRMMLVDSTAASSVDYWFDRKLKSAPVLPELKLGVSKVGEGIHSIKKFAAEGECDCFVYRDFRSLSDFVLSLPAKKRECVDTPYGLKMDVRLSKKQAHDSGPNRIDSGFTPIPLEGGMMRMVGSVEGHSVWIVREARDEVAVLCDTESEEAVKAWLKRGGARVGRVKVCERPRHNYWID